MHIRADFAAPAAVHADESEWVPSPLPGVARKMLDRVGGEVARATSLVRYASKSRFDGHTHGGGEEFLVLDGVFSDEHGDYPAGSYIRNPIGTRHHPFSKGGCTIFVKLHQFDADDRRQFVVMPGESLFNLPLSPGVVAADLHHFGSEHVRFLRLAAGAGHQFCAVKGGLEVLVIGGKIDACGHNWGPRSWLRVPDGASMELFSEQGAQLWVKSGHLMPGNLGPFF